MTTLKIFNLKNELIYKNDNMNDLLHQYGIENAYLDTDNQEVFETELLSDIFDEENINSSEVYYDLSDLDNHTKSLYFNE
tara:strand:- start:177 stop:416 length:240 start_codon:yes stop_codon:yes gene_type:complete